MWTSTNFHGMPKGILYLVPTPLGDVDPLYEMSAGAIEIMLGSSHFIAEDIRSARRLIARLPGHSPIDGLHFQEMGKHSGIEEAIRFLHHAMEGNDIVLISEAGSPCVADPGGAIVAAAHRMQITVKPLSGPSSIIQALMASGLNGQHFAFLGYLPISAAERNEAIRKCEKTLHATGQTQIIIETPFRNDQLLKSLIDNCQPSTGLCIASGIGTADEQIRTMPIGWWKENKPLPGKVPAIFLLGKSLT